MCYFGGQASVNWCSAFWACSAASWYKVRHVCDTSRPGAAAETLEKKQCGMVQSGTGGHRPESDPEERKMIVIVVVVESRTELPSKPISMCNLTRLERDESGDVTLLRVVQPVTVFFPTQRSNNRRLECREGWEFFLFLSLRSKRPRNEVAWLSRETAWLVLVIMLV
ncbi:uncharacterized protein CCOS01_15207 [Colletotrichum costaricense]|uniref:Uncharacterized protein n=1 Tax=Colletotrichum costaricense TaxID=1209916 RepID=A0AAI9YHW3_9PEZI|nr:uncharacterized protein CCOS01_15207 [Colletotrichum costaricense]KAK1510376.1 hypothetical protein CCOS01_15207 [Colletotrichum costaricense]